MKYSEPPRAGQARKENWNGIKIWDIDDGLSDDEMRHEDKYLTKDDESEDESMRAPQKYDSAFFAECVSNVRNGDSRWLGHDFNCGHLGACRVISIKPDQKWPCVGAKFLRRGKGEIYRVASVNGSGQIAVELVAPLKMKSSTQTPPTDPRFKLVPFRDLVPGDDPLYLVDGLIPRVGLAVVWGPPKCGKSFWVFDLALHVALGWPYRGRRIEPGHVVYCAFEGASGFKNRAEAFRRRHLVGKNDPTTFHLMPARTDLVADHAALIASLRNELGDNVPSAVVLDTLNRSLQGSESKDEDMGAYVKAADAIREAFDCVVIVVHHCGIEGTRPRGHTSLTGAVDAQLAVKRDAAKTIFVEVEWMKDGEEGAVLVSKLDSVNVGTNRYGQDITSCVVVPVDSAAVAQGEAKLTQNETTMFGILHDAGASGLTTEEWNQQARSAGLGVRRRADLQDFRQKLKAKGRVRCYGDRWTVAV